MGLRLEVELARGAPAAHLRVLGVVVAEGHARVGDVGDARDEVEQLVLALGALGVELGDAVLVGGDLGLRGLGLVLLALAHELADLLGNRVAVGLELLDLDDGLAALLVELEEALAIPVGVLAGLACLVHDVGVLTDELDVEHRPYLFRDVPWHLQYVLDVGPWPHSSSSIYLCATDTPRLEGRHRPWSRLPT